MLARTRAKFLIMAALVAIIAFAVVEGLYWWRHVTVTNAWLDADFTVMTSSVNGTVQRIEVKKGDAVAAGTLLAVMDSEIVELGIISLEADLEQARAEKNLVESELTAFRQDIRDQIETQETIIAVQAHELETLERRLAIAKETMDRNATLVQRNVISTQTNDAFKDRVLEITSEIRGLETKIAEKQRKIAELKGMKTQEAIFQSRIAVIERGIQKLEVSIRQSRRELDKMHIYAPIDAVVNEVYVNAGSYIEDADRVFLLHDPVNLWIEAPVDDSEIRHVAVGQPVEIDIEAHPYVEFTGRVAAIGRATVGSMTGNNDSSRGAPRLPVRIELDPTVYPLWPGVRATVHIRIR